MPSLGLGNSIDTSSVQNFNNYYLALDGTGDYGSIDDGAGDVSHNLTDFGVDGTAKEFSTSFWIYLAEADAHYVYNLGGHTCLAYNTASTKVLRMGVDMSPSVSADFNFAFGSNTWYHCVFTCDDTAGKMYVNGSLEDSETFGASPEMSTARSCRIGARHNLSAGGYNLNGRIDEFAMYDTVLSAADALALYNGGNPTDLNQSSSYDTDRTSNLRLWFRMGDNPSDNNTTIANSSTATNKLSLELTLTNAVIASGSF